MKAQPASLHTVADGRGGVGRKEYVPGAQGIECSLFNLF